VTAHGPLVLALDLGGTKVEAALVDADAAMLPGSRTRRPTGREAGPDALEAAVRAVVRGALAAVPPGRAVAAAGVGSAGPVSARAGTVSPLNLPAWRAYDLAALVRDASGLPVTLRLDGLCIALAEHWAGALRNRSNAMGIVVSTGIGGGLLLDGRLVGGRDGNAGHLGQLQLATRTRAGRDTGVTLEGLASGPRIVEWARARGWSGAAGEDLAVDYAAGHPVAVAAVARCTRFVGEALASACALLDLEAVAIGGGFARVAPDFVDRVAAVVADVGELDGIAATRVVPAALGDDAPLIGAAGLVHRADLLPA